MIKWHTLRIQMYLFLHRFGDYIQDVTWFCNATYTQTASGFIKSVSQPFPPTALWGRHTKTVQDSTSSYKIDYVIMIKNFLNLEGHQNPISGSTVKAILLKGWILPIGGVASGRVCACSLHGRLVLILYKYINR